MKITVAATLLASATAFAPSQKGAQKVAPVHASAELESMVGVGPETGGKIVSALLVVKSRNLCIVKGGLTFSRIICF